MANTQNRDPSLEVTIPRKINIAILFALILQIIGGVWGVANFYYSQKDMQTQMTENANRMTTQINELKSTIYTRNEALLQFAAMQQENHRQDSEIQELRQKMYGGR